MPKILHCADIHFDSPFTAHLTADEANLRREDMRETFSRIIEYAKNVDIMLIAGDLFNSAMVSRETINFLVRKFSEILTVKIFIAAGNHDCISESSYYTSVDWGNNVHIFGKDTECVELKDLNTCIYGVSFTKKREPALLLKNIETDKTKTNLLVMHGDVVSTENTSNYNPITKQQIEMSGMSYIALGHVHKHSGINREGNVYWAYSGTPEGRGFDECGAKGFIMGEVNPDAVLLEFVSCSKRRCYEIEIDMSPLTVETDNEARANLILNEALKTGTDNDLYKITLTGEVAPELPINTEILKDKLKNSLYYLKINDNTIPAFNYEEIAKENSMRGLFVRYMLEKIYNSSDADQEIAERAIKIGLHSMQS